MGKRSSFDRKPRDFYPTPAAAVAPLLPHIKDIKSFDEPCAGGGALIDILEATGVLHQLIIHLSSLAPTWLLFDADWAHTKQAVPYLERCRKIVSVGRVKWIPDSKMTGKDNCAFYLFRSGTASAPIEFYGRE
jgi:hypothetical protein